MSRFYDFNGQRHEISDAEVESIVISGHSSHLDYIAFHETPPPQCQWIAPIIIPSGKLSAYAFGKTAPKTGVKNAALRTARSFAARRAMVLSGNTALKENVRTGSGASPSPSF